MNLNRQVRCGNPDPHPAHPLFQSNGVITECAGTPTDTEVRDQVVAAIQAMHMPVLCTYCREVYDMSMVHNRDRTFTGVMWLSPCCHKPARDHPKMGYEMFSMRLLVRPR